MGIAFLYYWPTLLALVTRTAPPKVNATMMGITFLSLFIASNFVGWIGSFYESMTPTGFWLLHAGISAAGGLSVIAFRLSLGRVLARRT
jgi:POT family proton-dependent oligopeptide transporter